MAKRQDIRQDDDGDIFINTSTGDLELVVSDNQHVSDILQSISGDYKEFPLIGVNFFQFSSSVGQNQNIERVIRTQVSADGYQITKIEVPENLENLQDITVFANAPEL